VAHIQLDIDFLSHPKVMQLDALTELLFIRAILYSARHLTDGFIPHAVIPLLAYNFPEEVGRNGLINQLRQAKLFHSTPSGYRIHDYLKYQLSKRQVLELIQKRKESGQAGGRASAQAKGQAKGQAKPRASAQAKLNDSSTDFNPIPIPLPLKEKTKILVSPPKVDKSGDKSGTGFERLSEGLKKLFQEKIPPIEEPA
jgi:hypothetical protein